MTKDLSIAQLNDALRRSFSGGKLTFTNSFNQFGPEFAFNVVAAIRDFDSFTRDNDPWGERDFGTVVVDDIKCFWKIDYFNLDMTAGSEDPANPDITCRVMTIGLMEDY